MPAKNVLKVYVFDGFYHIYNRGVEKRKIFLSDYDYCYFLSLLKIYLLPKEKSLKSIKNEEEKIKLLRLNNFYQKIELLAYCLMPNHFHLLIKQKEKEGIKFFMKSLGSKYVGYFNKKYKRIGPLFQGIYKAVLIKSDEQLIHVSRYIHLNPKNKLVNFPLENYHWSSYSAYINNWNVEWLKKDYILSFFNKTNYGFNGYKEFVEGYQEKSVDESLYYKELLMDL